MEPGCESHRDRTPRPHPSSSHCSLSLIQASGPARLALSQDLLSHLHAMMQTQPPGVPWEQTFTFPRLQNMGNLMTDCTLPCPAELICVRMHSPQIVLYTVQLCFAFINLFKQQTDSQIAENCYIKHMSLLVSHCTGEIGVQKEGTRSSRLQLIPSLQFMETGGNTRQKPPHDKSRTRKSVMLS